VPSPAAGVPFTVRESGQHHPGQGISQRTGIPRAFRALLPELMRELSYYEMTGRWPTDAA